MRQALGASFTAFLVLLSARSTTAHDPITTKVTFAREIRAILSARCAACHAAGGSAPMPLTTYEEVRPWARAIKEQVLLRRMPKWHAARGFGAFKNDPTLTPIEMALIVSWVDGGLPRDAPGPAPVASAFPGRRNLGEGGRRKIGLPVLTVPPGATQAVWQGGSRWISGWSFEPGDPLVTSATISSDAGAIGTWVAGDAGVRLPPGSAMRVSGRVRVELRRRETADYEQPFTPKRSVLRLATEVKPPARRAWTEQVACGAAHAGRPAELIAVRPIMDDGGSARIWLERIGAPRTAIGWFRDFESRYARTYWLARPAELAIEARLQADVRCALEITLVTARR
jgi:mono/diheme cytochrome c family protein